MKAPFKRGTKLTVTDSYINKGSPTAAKYVKWYGFQRASLVMVKLDENGELYNVHIKDCKIRV